MRRRVIGLDGKFIFKTFDDDQPRPWIVFRVRRISTSPQLEYSKTLMLEARYDKERDCYVLPIKRVKGNIYEVKLLRGK